MDGFIADPDDDVGPLFDWYSEGPVEFTFPGDGMQTHVSAASAGHLDRVVSELGVASAIAQAQAVAGERAVVIASANIAGHASTRGSHFFSGLERYPVLLEDPVIVPGQRVTHMYFRVRR